MGQYNEWLKEAREWAESAFALFDLYDLAENLKISFNNRFTARAGDASFIKNEIRLSAPLWPRMTSQERYETVIHEVSHIISYSIYKGRIKAHGYEWRKIMLDCGVEPNRLHNIDRTGLKRKRQPRFPAFCNCDTPHNLTRNVVRKILSGNFVYTCKTCKGRLVLPQQTIAACNPSR